MQQARLSVNDLCKSFSVPVLKHVTLSVIPGEIHAIIGENGAGKSTLVNILAGLLAKDSGEISLDGVPYEPVKPTDGFDAGISCVSQELSIIGTLSVAENIALRNLPRKKSIILKRKLEQQALKMLQLVGLEGVDPKTPASSLRLAEHQLLEISKALVADSRLLILDEPTAALTGPQADLLHEIIADVAATGTSVIYISHRLEDVRRVSDTVSILRDGQVVTSVPTNTLTVADMIEHMMGRSNQEEQVAPIQLRQKIPVLKVEKLSNKDLPYPISFDCNAGEIIGIAGLAGSGRSELLQTLFGLLPSVNGHVSRCMEGTDIRIKSARQAVKLGIGFLTEDRKLSGIYPGQSVLTNMMLPGISRVASTIGVIDRVLERTLGAKLVSKLAVKCSSLDQHIENLSGGNQQKALIARWINCESDIFLLDEPTRGVDVGTKSLIYSLLFEIQGKGKCILLTSSEIEELMKVCNRILVLSDRKLVRIFERGQWTEVDILSAAFQEYKSRTALQDTGDLLH